MFDTFLLNQKAKNQSSPYYENRSIFYNTGQQIPGQITLVQHQSLPISQLIP